MWLYARLKHLSDIGSALSTADSLQSLGPRREFATQADGTSELQPDEVKIHSTSVLTDALLRGRA